MAADTQKVLCPWCWQPCVVLREQRRPAFREERGQTYRGEQGRQRGLRGKEPEETDRGCSGFPQPAVWPALTQPPIRVPFSPVSLRILLRRPPFQTCLRFLLMFECPSGDIPAGIPRWHPR